MAVLKQHWAGLEEAVGFPRPKSVRISPPITFEPGKDFFRTDRGVSWGIKVTDVGDIQAVHVFVQSGTSWTVGAELAGLSWPLELAEFTDMRSWFKARVLPRLNAWLTTTFPVSNTPGTPSEQLDKLVVGGLRIADINGKLIASLE